MIPELTFWSRVILALIASVEIVWVNLSAVVGWAAMQISGEQKCVQKIQEKISEPSPTS